MVQELLEASARGEPAEIAAARFHRTLAEMIVAVARHAGQDKVALSGGCFQNRLLTELAVRRLRQEGFQPYWHQRVPPNDGGIALGQLVAAAQSCEDIENGDSH
jgi:hydrogenase maturation protein HypF